MGPSSLPKLRNDLEEEGMYHSENKQSHYRNE